MSCRPAADDSLATVETPPATERSIPGSRRGAGRRPGARSVGRSLRGLARRRIHADGARGPPAAARRARPASGPCGARRGGRPRDRRGRVLVPHEPALGVGRGGPMVRRRVRHPRPAGDPQAHRPGGRGRLRPGLGARPDETVPVCPDIRCGLDVLVDLPVHAAAGAAAALVQPRLPLRAHHPRHPADRRHLLRRPHQRSDDPAARGDPGPRPAPGRLCGRADPRRHPLGGPGPARGGQRPRHPGPRPLPADHPAPGHEGDPAHRVQRDHRPGQGHLDRLRARPCGAVLHHPADLRPHPAGAADAAGRDGLVRRDHVSAVDRPVLHRAPLRPGRRAHPAAHPAAEPARPPRPPLDLEGSRWHERSEPFPSTRGHHHRGPWPRTGRHRRRSSRLRDVVRRARGPSRPRAFRPHPGPLARWPGRDPRSAQVLRGPRGAARHRPAPSRPAR